MMIRPNQVRAKTADELEEEYSTYLADLLSDVSNVLINRGSITEKQYEHIAAAAKRVRRQVINSISTRQE